MAVRRARSERGAVAVIVAIMLVLLATFAAATVNVGHIMKVRTELQVGADAAALAGALDLDGTSDVFGAVRASASNYGELHYSDIVQVDVDPDADVRLGFWDRFYGDVDKYSTCAFIPFGQRTCAGGLGAGEVVSASRTNAVQVVVGREAARGNAMPLFLPAFLSAGNDTDIPAEAVALAGGPCESCTLPIAFAKCLIRPDPDGPLVCGAQLRFSNDGTDNIGFTSLDPDDAVSTNRIIDILRGGCRNHDADEPINVSNGNNLTPQMITAFQPYVGQRVTAPIIDTGPACDPRFNRQYPVDGYAEFTIVEVRGPPRQPRREIIIQVDCNDTESEAAGGCGFYSVEGRPRLVR